MIGGEVDLFDEASDALADAFGPVEARSEVMDFDFTHYYDDEMGSPLYRRFVSFAGPHSPDILADAKVRTNAIEQEFADRLAGAGPARPINLDVGYVESSKLVLASMKNFSHRIYLRDGVYAEITLQFRHGKWHAARLDFPGLPLRPIRRVPDGRPRRLAAGSASEARVMTMPVIATRRGPGRRGPGRPWPCR